LKANKRARKLEKEFSDFLLLHPSGYFAPLKDYLINSNYEMTGKKIMEFGCGSGGILPLLLDESPSKLVGLDFSAKSIDFARNNASQEIQYICGDIVRMNSPIDCFDLIISHSTLQYVNDIEETLKALRKNLVPGGVLIATIERKRRIDIINLVQSIGLYILPTTIKRRLHVIWTAVRFVTGEKRKTSNEEAIFQGKIRYLCIPVVNHVSRSDLIILLEQSGYKKIMISDAPKLDKLSTPHYLITARAGNFCN